MNLAELADDLTAVKEAFLRVSVNGHRCGYDWNADPRSLTLTESLAFDKLNRLIARAKAGVGSEKLPAMLPCPFCGFRPNVEDDDAVYPANRERTVWSANCYSTSGGCDASVLGDSAADAVAAWNRRAGGSSEQG
jgi:hypothetical protein